MAHGQNSDVTKSVRIAAAAQQASLRLDADRATLYFDLIMHSLSEAARKALQTMNPAKYEYQSDFARSPGRRLAMMAMSRLPALGLLVVLAACGGMNPKPVDATASSEVTYELIGTRWALVRLGDQAVTISEGGREAYLALNAVETRVVGYAGCNRIASTFQLNGAQFSFGEVIATRMFCPDMPTETALLEAMQATASWKISGSQLDLLDANRHRLAGFEARNL